jgi:hypothetical protein
MTFGSVPTPARSDPHEYEIVEAHAWQTDYEWWRDGRRVRWLERD